jgi:hypothetical protein
MEITMSNGNPKRYATARIEEAISVGTPGIQIV